MMYDTYNHCIMYVYRISEAPNGDKYVKTVINNSERFTSLSIQILSMCLISVMII